MKLRFWQRKPENPDGPGRDQTAWLYWAQMTRHGLVWRCCGESFNDDHAYWCNRELLGPLHKKKYEIPK